MSNELQMNQNPALPYRCQSATINVNGERNTFISKADKVENNNITYMQQRVSAKNKKTTKLRRMNTNFYNLFVIDSEPYDNNSFVVPKTLALTNSISDELRNKYSCLTDDAVEHIMTFPSIFTTPNHRFGRTDADHYAFYGIVTEINKEKNVIRIYFDLFTEILPQQLLNEQAAELGIKYAPFYNELNDEHWTIKKTNIIDVLRKNGYNLTVIA